MMCEKCWNDAYTRHHFVNPGKSQADHYRELLEERKANPCQEHLRCLCHTDQYCPMHGGLAL